MLAKAAQSRVFGRPRMFMPVDPARIPSSVLMFDHGRREESVCHRKKPRQETPYAYAPGRAVWSLGDQAQVGD